uniref:Uncharacterized protein n=1 Tax=Podoviridae sp. ctsNK10 TaxID=2826582 RepID=A0A8S5NLW8_9CAUD|nr:MAG TPA: hypothetical protein [Podoviridae sp. ctsNK10]
MLYSCFPISFLSFSLYSRFPNFDLYSESKSIISFLPYLKSHVLPVPGCPHITVAFFIISLFLFILSLYQSPN